MFAIPLESHEMQEGFGELEEPITEEVEAFRDILHQAPANMDLRRSALNEILILAPDGNMPQRDFEAFLLGHFPGVTFVCFRYGQKQPLEDVQKVLQALLPICIVDVAVGLEFAVEGRVLAFGTQRQRTGKDCFSFLLQRFICNLYINDTSQCSKLIPGANRIVGYNTVNHVARKLKKNLCLKLKAGQEAQPATLIGMLAGTMDKALMSIRENVVPAFANSKLRLEAY